MYLRLKLITGEDLQFDTVDAAVTIGRSNRCDIVIPHEGISRQHCLIESVDDKLYVTDLGSTNGVLIDGQKIPTGVRTPYSSFLPLSFGAVKSAEVNPDMRTNPTHLLVSKKASEEKEKSEQTKTIKLELDHRQDAKKKKKAKKVQEGEPDKGLSPVSFLVALLIAGAIFWFMSHEEAPKKPLTEGQPLSIPGKEER